VTDLLRWGSRGFPEVRSFRVSATNAVQLISFHRRAAATYGALALALAAAVFYGVGYVRYERLAAAERAAAQRAESANAELQDALARLRNELGATHQALTTAQGRIAALSDEERRGRSELAASQQSKADRIAQLTRALEQTQRDLHLAEAQRATLTARLGKAEADLAEEQTRHTQSQAGLDQSQKKLQQLAAERDRAASERDHLRARVTELEQKLSLLQTRQSRPVAAAPPEPPAAAPPAAASLPAPAAAPSRVAVIVPTGPAAATAAPPAATPPAAPAVAAGAPPEPAPRSVPMPAVATAGHGGLAQFERVLASTGVDVRQLFAQFGVNRGMGGPFIPVRGQPPEGTLTPEKLAALHSLISTLPISAPLASYDVSSPFGVRGDPINERGSYHTGIDLRAPYMSPVYATAGGTVTYAGYRDDYGKVVEIDHGNGIATRYAHLHRFTVSVGQRLPAHSQIGFLGSSGRATGPHVHYEVLVNGEPQDPAKFMGLARLVPAAGR
jgi:murein DD-endopeptidase MepM/ murein hydrolase activator NlpD